MDPNATVDQMVNIVSDLDGMKKGFVRTRLLADLAECRKALREWKRKGGYEPAIGWAAALRL